MKNSLIQTKRLLFKIIPHFIILVIVVIIAFFAISNSIDKAEADELKYLKYKQEQDSLFIEYKTTLDSIDKANFFLEECLLEVNNKLDYITAKQHEINEGYEEEMNNIIDLTLTEHSIWFYAKLDSIRQYYHTE